MQIYGPLSTHNYNRTSHLSGTSFLLKPPAVSSGTSLDICSRREAVGEDIGLRPRAGTITDSTSHWNPGLSALGYSQL